MTMMKSSNTEWLGNIPAEWDVAQIGNYYELRNEKVSDYDFEPLSVTMKGIVPQLATAAKSDDHSNRKLVKKGDFVINSRSDRRGSCGISPLDGSVSLINTVMEPRGEMNPQYYNWLFHTEQFADEFYKWGHGIVDDLWTTRWQEMKKILIVAPSPDEQQAIADYLDETCSKIDEIIAEAKISIDEYKELKQSILFETMTQGIQSDRKYKTCDYEWLGKVPEDWSLMKITHILDDNDSYPIGDGDHGLIKTDSYKSEGIPYIRVQNIGWGTPLLMDNVVYISKEDNERIKGSQLKPGDVLFVKTGATIGKTAIVPNNIPISNTTSHVGKITVSKEHNSKYIFYLLSSFIGYKQFWDIACMKATRPELSISEIKQMKVLIPSTRDEEDEIVEYLDNKLPEYETLICIKESLINDLEVYKKSLIYEVVTGKRRVV